MISVRKEIGELERVRDERKYGVPLQPETSENLRVTLDQIEPKIKELDSYVQRQLSYIKHMEVVSLLYCYLEVVDL